VRDHKQQRTAPGRVQTMRFVQSWVETCPPASKTKRMRTKQQARKDRTKEYLARHAGLGTSLICERTGDTGHLQHMDDRRDQDETQAANRDRWTYTSDLSIGIDAFAHLTIDAEGLARERLRCARGARRTRHRAVAVSKRAYRGRNAGSGSCVAVTNGRQDTDLESKANTWAGRQHRRKCRRYSCSNSICPDR
jgi:hypothetical protein